LLPENGSGSIGPTSGVARICGKSTKQASTDRIAPNIIFRLFISLICPFSFLAFRDFSRENSLVAAIVCSYCFCQPLSKIYPWKAFSQKGRCSSRANINFFYHRAGAIGRVRTEPSPDRSHERA